MKLRITAIHLFLTAVIVSAQTPAPRPATPSAQPVRPPQFPVHAPGDPAAIERGKGIYTVNCQFCHGVDARGGDGGGPNLIRSQLVLEDNAGEKISTIILNGREAMPKFAFNTEQVSDVAAFLHNFPVGSRGQGSAPLNIVVGDASAGKAYFQSHCTTCHSLNGDLHAIGSRLSDPKQLQNAIVSGSSTRGNPFGPVESKHPTTATITLASGQTIEGPLLRADDFYLTIKDKDGNQRTFNREDAYTKVAIHNPLQAHIDMLPTWDDKDIHNLTAYLSTVK